MSTVIEIRYSYSYTIIDALKTVHLTFLFFTYLGRVQGEHKPLLKCSYSDTKQNGVLRQKARPTIVVQDVS